MIGLSGHAMVGTRASLLGDPGLIPFQAHVSLVSGHHTGYVGFPTGSPTEREHCTM
ncbi:hypothetical protein DPMN_034437 [Dreissena polymorpha]|uniref:Uncharacterized protein n=1 Tax=Dreissena polymorpha TaxID=45954 RepID=A0A9D4RKZ5_DREPO|nr:hypothetical protein DPMN_034437 [Dreissena polymorpha]